jgi:hypothetical protein
LQSRNLELETLKAEVNGWTKQAADAASARDRAENVLQQELKRKRSCCSRKTAAFKELRESSTNTVYALENQLNDKSY